MRDARCKTYPSRVMLFAVASEILDRGLGLEPGMINYFSCRRSNGCGGKFSAVAEIHQWRDLMSAIVNRLCVCISR
jgi:hypothetical protein